MMKDNEIGYGAVGTPCPEFEAVARSNSEALEKMMAANEIRAKVAKALIEVLQQPSPELEEALVRIVGRVQDKHRRQYG